MSSQRTQEQERLRADFLDKDMKLESKNCWQALFFTWITPLIQYGNKVELDQDIIPQMAEGQHAKDQFVVFRQKIASQTTGSPGMRLVKSMVTTYWRSIKVVLLTACVSSAVSMLLPNITKLVISYVQSASKQLSYGLQLIALILGLKFAQNLAESHMMYHFALLGYNISNNLSVCIFNKALKYPTLCSKEFQTSELINYSQVDAQRMTYLGFYTAIVLFFPIQLAIGIYLMYSFIGVSFLAGIGIILLMSVFIFINSKLNAKANEKLLKAKDKRMKLATEIFNLIRFIKVNAWEKYFFKKLNQARNEELKHIKKTSLLGVISIFFFWVTTPLILSVTFGTYVLISTQEMTAEKAFTTIILFSILQFPLRALPESITQLTQIWVSLKRIGKFLYTAEIDRSYIVKGTQSDNAIEIRDGSFYWDLDKKDEKKDDKDGKTSPTKKEKVKDVQNKQEGDIINTSQIEEQVTKQPSEYSESDLKKSLLSVASQVDKISRQPHVKALKKVYIDIKRGKFTVILGDIGSGKSSLLYSILGEMKPQPNHNPKIAISGSIALVVQKAWIMSCSIEQNITMTAPKNERRFEEAIKYSCLEDDLKSMPDGVKTKVGQKGINVSGGQKARINLARALFSDKDIYLLDDIISAVDVHVGNFIVKETVLNYLENKTRILVTHAISYAKYADQIIVMKRGEIVQQGSYQQVRESHYFKQIQQLELKHPHSNEEGTQKKIDHIPTIKKQKSNVEVQVKVTDKLVEELMLPEDREKGSVSWQTYKTYIVLNGGWIFPTALIIFMSCWMTLSTLANVQIQRWCENPKNKYYLWLFAGFSIGSAFFAFLRALTLVFSGIKQGAIAHKKMIKGLLYASIPEFFDRVPVGRILNRVSKDLRQLDQAIGFAFGGVLVSSFSLAGNLVICVYASTPYIAIPMIFFVLMCYYFKNYYMNAQRESVRLENISSSPIVSGFSETINGLPTLRAYELEQKFIQRQTNLVNVNKRNRMAREAMQCWFSQRLAWMSYFINITAIGYCVLASNYTNWISGSMAGLLLAYAFSIDENVINLTYGLATLENKMISVERVTNFMKIEPEAGYSQYTKKWSTFDEPPIIQVDEGNVKFDHLKICYRPGLPAVLKNLCLTIQPGEKIGIVGRTGAGKSTITSSILRLVQPTEGTILLDNKSIVEMPLKDLRSSITLIAQEPVLIEGTLKQNLDPRNEHPDELLLETLKKCCLETVFSDREGLSTKISDAGDNLSIGEKQLVCIARAILRNSKLVLIDEATANIDVKSDQLIQQTIRECFKQATVITIAHRIKTIMNSDRIMVLNLGEVVEFDTPDRLLQNKSHFYQLYMQSQTQTVL